MKKPSAHFCLNPRCHARKLIKIRTRTQNKPFIPRLGEKGTFKYYKCRVCGYREDSKGKPLTGWD